MEPKLYTIIDAVLAIWRQRWLVFLVFSLIVLTVGTATLLMPKTYLSESKLFVRLGRENSAIDVTAGMGERAVFGLPLNRESEMNSVAAMMETKDLYGNIVDKIGADRILKRKPKKQAAQPLATSKANLPDQIASATDGPPQQEDSSSSGGVTDNAKGKGDGWLGTVQSWFADLRSSVMPVSTPDTSSQPTNADSQPESQSLVDTIMPWLIDMGIVSDLDDRERAIIRLKKKTKIEVNKLSYVIAVSHETHSPELAQEIVAALMDEYIKLYARTHRPARGSEFLLQQVQEAEASLSATEKEFEAFKTRTGLMSVDDQRRLFVDRINRLENELLDTTSALKATESEVKALTGLLDDIPASQPIAKTSGAGNDGIDAMREELFRLQMRREELVAKYNEGHPNVREIDQRLEKTQDAFDSAASGIIEQVEGPSKLYEGARLQMVQRRPSLDALRAKADELGRQLESARSEIAAFNDNETMFLRLQRQEELSKENYLRLRRVLQQAEMDYAMQAESLSNLSVFQPASLNPKPYRPSKLLNGMAGMCLGAMCAVSLAVLRDFRRQYLSWVSSHGRSSDLIVLAEIPHQSSLRLLAVNQEAQEQPKVAQDAAGAEG